MGRAVCNGHSLIDYLVISMKVAVTGASGFVGRYVLAELACRNIDVVAVTRDPARLEDSSGGYETVRVEIAQAGAGDFDLLGRPDLLIHLAWAGLPNYLSLHHFETELPSQYRFLTELIRTGLPALLVAGTCFEYGMQSGALSEGLATRPANPYGYAKDALRRQLEFLRVQDPFALTWIRLFYVFGEGQPRASLYPQLKEAVSRGDAVFDMSAGEQLRDYLPVEEVARLIVDLAMKRADLGCVNICSGKPLSVRSLVESWLKENDWNIALNLGCYPYPSYEPMAFWGDRRRLDDILVQS